MKRFSISRFVEDARRFGCSSHLIAFSIQEWAQECSGKTEEEMLEMGYDTYPEWMVDDEHEEEELA